jgi:REP element-mobilizing transposase RayT
VGALFSKEKWRLQATSLYRRSLRLKDYDYSQAGAYFVTVCTQNRACLFGEVAGDKISLNEVGQLAEALWRDLPTDFPTIALDTFIVMPNHIHGIVVLPDRTAVGAALVAAREDDRARAATRAAPALSDVVGAFKSLFAVRYIQGVKSHQWPPFNRRVWQRNYYEHVVRDETDLVRIRTYIDENPLRWQLDEENPDHL